jgi:transcription antitermination factor NusG
MPISCSGSNLPLDSLEPNWYTAYTCAHHEKRIAAHLSGRLIEHFLPLYQRARRWKDRTKVIESPLFPSYVFVRIDIKNRLRVLGIPGVVRLVSFNGAPAALPEEQINALRKGLTQNPKAEPCRYFPSGRSVRVKSGPFEGLEGILIRYKGNFRVVLSIELIQRSVSVDVDAASIELSQPQRS